MQQTRLGRLLVEAKLIDEPKLEQAVLEQKRRGGKLGEVLVALQLISERQLTEVLGLQLMLPTVDLDTVTAVPREALERLPRALAQDFGVLPLELLDGGKVLALASADVLRPGRLEQLRHLTRCDLQVQLGGPAALKRAFLRCYGEAPEPLAPAPARRPGAVGKDLPAPQLVQALVELLVEKGCFSELELQQKLLQLAGKPKPG